MKSPNIPFERKCVLFSGDFRQILPVVPRGSRGMILFMCFQSSPLYQCMSFRSLSENMRLQSIRDDEDPDPAVFQYPNFLLKVGDGILKRTEDSFIELPPSVNIVESSTKLVESVFPNLKEKYDDVQWLKSRAILAPTNSRLQSLNSEVAKIFPHDFSYYRIADSVVCDSVEAQNAAELRYPVELLNSIEVDASLPGLEIALKKGLIVMLLRNIKLSSGHVNGTRYVVDNMTPNVLFLTSVLGSNTE